MNVQNFERYAQMNQLVSSKAYRIAKESGTFDLKGFALAMQKSPQSATQTLKPMLAAGLVVKIGYGAYQVTGVGPLVESLAKQYCPIVESLAYPFFDTMAIYGKPFTLEVAIQNTQYSKKHCQRLLAYAIKQNAIRKDGNMYSFSVQSYRANLDVTTILDKVDALTDETNPQPF